MKSRHWLVFGWAVATCGTAHAQLFDRPPPEAYQRPEDQQRARLFDTPCTEADIGRHCHRMGSGLFRNLPCATHRGNVIHSLPTAQCYKMEAPRRFRGIWIDAFEGQQFIPEGATVPEYPDDPKAPGFREKFDAWHRAKIWIDFEPKARAPRRHQGARKQIEFIGRKAAYPGAYGHFGMSGGYVIVDRVIAVEDLPDQQDSHLN